MNHDIITIGKRVEEVEADMLSRNPNAAYSIFINLWQDGDSQVECRYFNDELDLICQSIYRHGEIKYSEGKLEMMDEDVVVAMLIKEGEDDTIITQSSIDTFVFK